MKEKNPPQSVKDLSWMAQSGDFTIPRLFLTPQQNLPIRAQIEPVLFLQCVYGEARGEPREGIELVAQVIMNRARLGTWFGASVRDVILKKNDVNQVYQFDTMNPKNPNFTKLNKPNMGAWMKVLQLALPYYFGVKHTCDPALLNYHADWIETPHWGDKLEMYKKVGHHIFFLDKSYHGKI